MPLQRYSLNIIANVVATLYMLIGSKKAFFWVKPNIWQFLLFACVALASNVLFAWLSSEDGSYFNHQGLISYLVWPFIMLLAGLVLARRYNNGLLAFVPAILWLVADIITVLLQSGIQFLSQQNWLPEWGYAFLPTIFALLFAWQTIALLWIFAQELDWSWIERMLILLGVGSVLIVWQDNIKSQPIFKLDPVERTISEQEFYQQPLLLNQSLAKLQLNRANVTDWYFLGIAGYADQDVFYSEIMQSKDLFDIRFGTLGYSLALINNNKTLADLPIASKTSIEMALQRIGKLINPEEDVLFLTLTSHGGDKVIEMQNPPMMLENVEASWLRQTLDNSGIKWRVIVISACYSGSFVDDLKSPTTLIITASAKDKDSFGCQNELDYTYFGQAFFAEGLRQKDNFADAFELAKINVAKREAEMGVPASEPQFVIGSLMKNALPAFEKSLIPKSINEKSSANVTDK